MRSPCLPPRVLPPNRPPCEGKKMFDYEVLKLVWWVLIGVLLIGFALTDG
ncbi:MAG TPA: cytochrome d ubiquinol oxidase subunit 2, partial [Pseudomonas sp.]|nr:cytochrome d ubiquinol oxidase subunit 2 [Pseudomonas sp.]